MTEVTDTQVNTALAVPPLATQAMDVSAVKEVQKPMGQTIVPKVPDGMTPEMAASLKEQSAQWVAQIMAMPGDQDLLEKVATLGIEAQQSAGQSIELLKAPINSIINPPKLGDQEAPDSLMGLRKMADRLDPAKIAEPTFFERLMGIFPPFARKQLERSITRIQEQTNSADDEINSILDSLRSAGETIMKSNTEIDTIVKDLKPSLERVKGTGYLCEEMMSALGQEYEKLTDDDPKKGQLINFSTYLSARYLDFNSMRELYNQLLIGLSTARQNNVVRAISLRRTIDVAGPALRIGTALQIINMQQEQAAAMDRATRDFVADLTVRNAKEVGESQRKAMQDLSSAALNIEKMKAAHNALIQAMDERDQLQLQVIQVARDNAVAFKEMAEELEARQNAVKLPEKAAINSIEVKI